MKFKNARAQINGVNVIVDGVVMLNFGGQPTTLGKTVPTKCTFKLHLNPPEPRRGRDGRPRRGP